MQLSDLLDDNSIACQVGAQSKKRALQELSEIIANKEDSISSVEVFDSLLNRERLGGTGVGHGAAIPHGRLKNCDKTTGAFIQLAEPVDFDAPDDQPVDLLFALIVPEESTDEHLQVLALLASMFNDEKLRNQLRHAKSSEAMRKLLMDWQQNH
ncbi:MAG: PTS IIA-like nitrogen regulatory protein PtsN [Thioalkalispiraceae bacterium]|jgi:PTS system nitrogen regulatory IIA component